MLRRVRSTPSQYHGIQRLIGAEQPPDKRRLTWFHQGLSGSSSSPSCFVIFGGSQLQKLARDMGEAQKVFKDGLGESVQRRDARLE